MSAKTILIVDDSTAVRRAVTLMLVGADYQTLEASDGAEALEVMKDHAVDLVLTDLHMPGVDGFGLVKALRANPAYRFVPVLVLTTECRDEIVSDLKRAGVTGVLQKPIEREGLTQALRRCLEQ